MQTISIINKMRLRSFVYVLASLLVLLALGVAPAMAQRVDVTWNPDDEESAIRTRTQALASGFRRAVFLEALDVLPGELSETRRVLLADYLRPKARDYVQSYSESGLTNVDGVMTLSLEVATNRAALKREMRSLGLVYTVRTPWAFDLALTGQAATAWEQLGQLMELTGVVAQRGVEPLLELQHNPEEGIWTGRLTVGDSAYSSADKELPLVWYELWAKYFSRPETEAEAGLVDWVALEVVGWFSPDGVQAFAADLSGWEGAVEGATMLDMTMLPEGIRARWTVKTMDRDALVDRLESYLLMRGLTYGLDGAQPR